MSDYSLRECPFCGNPAEVVDGEPYSFLPNTPTKRIRCSYEYCAGYQIKIRFFEDDPMSVSMAWNSWNIRKRKNKLTWDGHIK